MVAMACSLLVGMVALTWAANTASNAAQEAQDELADTKAFLAAAGTRQWARESHR